MDAHADILHFLMEAARAIFFNMCQNASRLIHHLAALQRVSSFRHVSVVSSAAVLV